MSAISKKKQEQPQTSLLSESPEEIRRRTRGIKEIHRSGVGEAGAPVKAPQQSEAVQPTGLAADEPKGALCFLPKSLHRLASRAAEDRDLSSKRFFMEMMLIGLEQQGVITPEQRQDALALPPEYGWKGRRDSSSSDSSTVW